MQRLDTASPSWILGALLLSMSLGAVITISPEVALVVAASVIAVVGLTLPSSTWVAAALASALVARGLVGLGLLPGAATFLDIPLAWGALIVALLRRSIGATERSPRAAFTTPLLWSLAALAVAVFASFAFNPSEIARPVLYLSLLGEPFAAIAALVIEPPSERGVRVLKGMLFALLVVQIPVVMAQIAAYGFSDGVKGTLHGAGAGHHAIGAVAIVGAIWVLLSERPLVTRIMVSIPLFLIPFASDAKQVLFAVPAVILFQRWRGGSGRSIALFAMVAILGVGVLRYGASDTAFDFIDQQEAGRGGKASSAQLVWSQVTEDPASLLLGKGPAETVSRAAFMTTDRYLDEDSPLRAFGLHSSEIAETAFSEANEISGGRTSLNSALSSAIGVLGDLGLLGAAAFLVLFGCVIAALRQLSSPEAVAALAGWGMFLLLGFVYDWWEQPPFSMTLAVLTVLALSRASGARAPS